MKRDQNIGDEIACTICKQTLDFIRFTMLTGTTKRQYLITKNIDQRQRIIFILAVCIMTSAETPFN